MNEKVLKPSGADVLSSRRKLKKPHGDVGGGGGGGGATTPPPPPPNHHPLGRPRVRIMCVMSLVISCSLYNQTNFMKRNSHKFVRGVASFSTYVVGLAYFHFHIS